MGQIKLLLFTYFLTFFFSFCVFVRMASESINHRLSNLQNESPVVFSLVLKAWVTVFLPWEEGSVRQDLLALELLAQVLVRRLLHLNLVLR